MTENKELFLRAEDDGLPMRPSQEYARYKLKALELYIKITNDAMKSKWINRSFIDLQAGPGKNRISQQVVLGSPLLALTASNSANHFFFNELDETLVNALKARIGDDNRVTCFNRDANVVVDEICKAVREIKPTSLNIAFLDPEGLELKWETVRKLAQIPRTDLIINFSTQGILRNAGAKNNLIIDEFFGTPDWLPIYEKNRAHPRRALIDFYLSRLAELEYKTDVDPELPPAEIVAKNSKNSELYSVIFASRHELGAKFWKQAERYTNPQPRLF
jgi:three-Cys-motif partner protein